MGEFFFAFQETPVAIPQPARAIDVWQAEVKVLGAPKIRNIALGDVAICERVPDNPTFPRLWFVQTVRLVGSKANAVCPLLPPLGLQVSFGSSDL